MSHYLQHNNKGKKLLQSTIVLTIGASLIYAVLPFTDRLTESEYVSPPKHVVHEGHKVDKSIVKVNKPKNEFKIPSTNPDIDKLYRIVLDSDPDVIEDEYLYHARNKDWDLKVTKDEDYIIHPLNINVIGGLRKDYKFKGIDKLTINRPISKHLIAMITLQKIDGKIYVKDMVLKNKN